MNILNQSPRSRTEILLLVAFSGFLLFYGLGAFGLLGADEPRYAQVAREMLDRHDWVTPTLNSRPWLEKPPLYYWQAMLSYRATRAFGSANPVNEQTARFPGAFDAAIMIAAIYFYLRRSHPDRELDGALITASCVGVIGFAHAASTDMPLTATFAISLLAWFAFYQERGLEKRRRLDLAIFYISLALGTLAKGPIAPALAAVVIILFVAVKRDWRTIPETLWLPGIFLFFAVSLPWYIAVQMRNPQFFRVFILEHNLARFSSNVYHHPQPFWFYLPVFLLALMPWTIWLIAAIVERSRAILSDPKEAFASPDDSFALFLLIWMIVPVVFFSASQSKLPGYILPAVPAAALLVTEYLAGRREQQIRIKWPLAAAHGILCGLLVFGALSAAAAIAGATPHHLSLSKASYASAAIATLFAISIAGTLLTRSGPRLVRSSTMIAVVVSVTVLIRLAAPVIDATQSARLVAQSIQSFSREPMPVALYHVSRVQQYGLDFYLNRPTQSYQIDSVDRLVHGEVPGEVPGDAHPGVPGEAHLLVAASNTQPGFSTLLAGRRVSYLTSIPSQKLDLYWVGKE